MIGGQGGAPGARTWPRLLGALPSTCGTGVTVAGRRHWIWRGLPKVTQRLARADLGSGLLLRGSLLLAAPVQPRGQHRADRRATEGPWAETTSLDPRVCVSLVTCTPGEDAIP